MYLSFLAHKLHYSVKLYGINKKWRQTNKHNHTTIANVFNTSAVSAGQGTYGELFVLNHNSGRRLSIGDFCSIGPNVVFVLNSDHRTDFVSTFPFKVKYINAGLSESVSKGDIVIDSDVWIGYGAIILSGVHIGQGAVVAAGSVVTKDVDPYSIVAGNPAKVIKHRFRPEVVENLMKIDYSKFNADFVRTHLDELYSPVESLHDLNWLPRNQDS